MKVDKDVMSMKRYLVTGASGHLGNTIIQLLLQQEKQVRVLLLPNDTFPFSYQNQVEVVYGNVTDLVSLTPFFANPNQEELIVIHCAGIVSIASNYSPLMYDVNVNGTKNMLRLSEENHVYKFIYISSVHAIPEKKEQACMSEIASFDPNLVIGAYAKTKAEATQCVMDAALRGLNACIIHPSGIIGPNDYGHSHLTQLIVDFYRGKLFASVRGGYDFVDVRDVALGVLACVEKGRAKEGYILSNRYCSVKDLLELLHHITQKKRITFILPTWFVKLTAPLSELYYKILKQPPLYTAYSLYTLGSNSYFSHQKATQELDYQPLPLEITLKDTIAWLQEMKRI